jgi:hypothetical protein
VLPQFPDRGRLGDGHVLQDADPGQHDAVRVPSAYAALDFLLDALNEIAREIFASVAHLHPDAVQIIGELPPLALPDAGFLVTPVLALVHPICSHRIPQPRRGHCDPPRPTL